ncbi:3D domain-containing protein [Fundicoccus sp. Sow4_H7]|uniref:3D domain-containing protein n=1 Tax=Fundicoccus sp. Sow4_H7 TaxID=3438784 RepID=UPI003F928665
MRKSLKIAVAAVTLSVATMSMPFASAANWVSRSDEEVAASVNNAIQTNNSIYIIQWGDTLSSISRATGLSVSELAQVNQIANPDFILAGAVLFFNNVNHTMTYVDQTGAHDTYTVENDAVVDQEIVWEEPTYTEEVAEVTEPEYVVEDTTEWVPEETVEEDTAWEEVVVEEPVIGEPVEEDLVVEEPAWEEPAVEEEVPVWEEEPVVEEPVEEETEIEVPVEEVPVEEEPVEEVPVEEVPVEEPEIEEPVIEEPVVEEPVVEEPVVEEPVVEEPVIDEPVVEEPVEETPTEDPASYGRPLTVEATAYSRNEAGLSNFTANGTDLRVNGAVIAVDPTVIPLGTTVYVPGYGYLTAADTGGAIKGNKIDIHMENLDDVYQFGRQTITIYIVD